MLFNSFQFLIFFLIVTAVYFAVRHRARWPFLLFASCYFYIAFIPKFILVLFFLILVDYCAGLWIEALPAGGRARKAALVISLFANIAILGVFKYFNFMNANFDALFNFFGLAYRIPNLNIILPIGLSFHTFQSMAYTIEVYRGNQKAERNIGIYALYVLFYPQMVAGPIERPQNLIHQFREVKTFEYGRVADGIKLMTWGLFKKAVIADRLAVFVNAVYAHPTDYTGWPLLLATYLFAFQIYCDFSGYSDIAIGAARVMGFKLMQNFNRPYLSQSIAEFWTRWHISLSTWFKDYLYVPLGGNRVAKGRWYLNLTIVFLVSGLWHGANWTFVIWGALHGFYLIFSLITKGAREKLSVSIGLTRVPFFYKTVRILVTFHLVTFSWIFFRAQTFGDAWWVVRNIFNFEPTITADRAMFVPFHLAGAVFSLVVLETVHWLQANRHVRERFFGRPAWFRWTAYSCLVLVILSFGEFTSQDFIYFQF